MREFAIIYHQCPHCQEDIESPDTLAGGSRRCPGCASEVEVPSLADAAPSVDRDSEILLQAALNEGEDPIVASQQQRARPSPPRASKPATPRTGFATAWLVVIILANFVLALVYTNIGGLGERLLDGPPPGLPLPWGPLALTLVSLLNIVFAIALLFWRKWGFYGFAITSLLVFGYNLWSVSLGQAAMGLFGLVILYAVLQIGGEQSTWKQLR